MANSDNLRQEWDAIASAWIREARDRNPVRNGLLDPPMLEACGNVEGLRILDCGCGEGRFCRILAGRGLYAGVGPLRADDRRRPGTASAQLYRKERVFLVINEIYEYIKGMQIIDTHEHLPAFESERERHDVISEYLRHYFSVDLISAGLSRKDYERLRGNELGLMEKWNIVEKYWGAARHTGYGQALAIAARDLYGVDGINRDTITALNDAYLKSYEEEHYKKVLKDMSKIKVSILDREGDTPFEDRKSVV